MGGGRNASDAALVAGHTATAHTSCLLCARLFRPRRAALVICNVLFYNCGLLLQFAAFLRLKYTAKRDGSESRRLSIIDAGSSPAAMAADVADHGKHRHHHHHHRRNKRLSALVSSGSAGSSGPSSRRHSVEGRVPLLASTGRGASSSSINGPSPLAIRMPSPPPVIARTVTGKVTVVDGSGAPAGTAIAVSTVPPPPAAAAAASAIGSGVDASPTDSTPPSAGSVPSPSAVAAGAGSAGSPTAAAGSPTAAAGGGGGVFEVPGGLPAAWTIVVAFYMVLATGFYAAAATAWWSIAAAAVANITFFILGVVW